MAIKFLTDHVVEGPPREGFKAGQVVKDRDDASELHFVRRGVAAYYDEKSKALTNHEGRRVPEKPQAERLVVANNRDGEAGRAGEVLLADQTPQRASNGPAEVITSAVGTPAGDKTEEGK